MTGEWIHGRIRVSPLLGALVIILGTAGCSSGSDNDATESISVGLSMSGSVGDGPIVGATIRAVDANGTEILTTTSDSAANYEVNIPDGTPMPVTVTAEGGTDLVTGRAPDFELSAVATTSGAVTVNVSPLTTLAMQTTACAGDLTETNLNTSWSSIQSTIGMGFDNSLGNPMTTAVTPANAAAIVLANEALGEVIRRAEAALAATGSAADGDDILRSIGCDLADGSFDGIGPDVDPRIIVTVRAAELLVLLEVAAGRLEVDGQDATTLMDQALGTILPESPGLSVLDVQVTQGLLDQAETSLALFQGVYSDDALVDVALVLEGASPSTARAAIDGALDAGAQTDIASVAGRVALADDSEILELGERMVEQNVANPPLISFSARDSQVADGASTVLSWAVSNADQCVADGGWDGVQPTEGTFSTGGITQSTDFGLSCVGVGGSAIASVTVSVAGEPPPPEPDAPTLTLSAADSNIDAGASTTLNWSTTDADTCTASGGWSGSRDPSGSEGTGQLTSDTTYTLSCSGAGGSTQASVTVAVDAPVGEPSLTFTADDTQIGSNGSTTLRWSTANVDDCTASGGWSGGRNPSGSEGTGQLTSDTTYTLSCSGAGGSTQASVTVAVDDPAPEPTLTLSADDPLIDSGASTTLNWSSANADTCTASGGWTGGRATSGSESTGTLSTNTTFSLSCSGAGGTAVAMITVDVTGTLSISWVAPTENVDGTELTDLDSYMIYYGTQSGSYDNSVPVNDSEATSHDIVVPSGSYYVVMTASDIDQNESAYSNEVVKATN